MIRQLIKYKLFLFGAVLIGGTFLASLFYFIFFNDQIPSSPLLYDDNGRPLHAPYSGTVYPPLGTDEFGRDIAVVMLVGAKYTIGAAFLISLLRVVPAIFIGVFIQLYLKGIKRPLKSVADSLTYFPITLLAFLLLNWVSLRGILFEEGAPPSGIQIIIYVAVLSLIFIPINSVLIANEVELIYNKEFIACSRTLGAGKWRIITKHIRPFLVPQLWIILIREFIQSLILMSHLGILSIFIGGVVFKENLFGNRAAVSLSSEWAGTLGMWWDYLWTSYPWIAFIPIGLITLLILAAKGMLDSLEHLLASEQPVQMEKTVNEEDVSLTHLTSFQLLKARNE
ncbi:peptide ABC transporter permease [Planomicrobium okeanokoites]|uniref:peptide ABC transporter permease n=1 Tax=Planomicrobium okeanokoites TaxID=244 RepID=UPI0011843C40|nr:peptide ABC transporter permease [Planomicrobium okeanokoites]